MRSALISPVGQESRDIKPLPTRALQIIERGVQEEAVSWKVLFKIGENWRNGARPLYHLHAKVLLTNPFCQDGVPFKRLSLGPVRAQLPKIWIPRTLRARHCSLYAPLPRLN